MVDAATMWGLTYVGVPIVMVTGGYYVTTHLVNKFNSQLPLEETLDNLTEYTNQINQQVCKYYLERWQSLLGELKTNNSMSQVFILSLVQGYSSSEDLQAIFSIKDKVQKQAQIEILCNMLLNDMANEFISHVKSTVEGNILYSQEEIDILSKLRARVMTEASIMKQMNDDAFLHFQDQMREGKRSTLSLGKMLSGMAVTSGGMAASMFTNAAGFATGGIGGMVKMGVGAAMGGPLGATAASLGKKRTMKKQKKGIKGSKKRGRNKNK